MRMCRRVFIPYRRGVSVFGCIHVLRMVGTKAVRSMPTAITIESVGSLVSIQGIMPKRAIPKNTVSIVRIFLNPYWSEKRNIIILKISDAAVGMAPIPAPLDSCPKNIIQETIDHTNHVYGCG